MSIMFMLMFYLGALISGSASLALIPTAGIACLVGSLLVAGRRRVRDLWPFVISLFLTHLFVEVALAVGLGGAKRINYVAYIAVYAIVHLVALGILVWRVALPRVASALAALFCASYAAVGAAVCGMALSNTWP